VPYRTLFGILPVDSFPWKSSAFFPQEQAHLQFNAYSHFLSGNIIIKIVSYVLYASIILHAVDGLSLL
jgi:hypothetical protein